MLLQRYLFTLMLAVFPTVDDGTLFFALRNAGLFNEDVLIHDANQICACTRFVAVDTDEF